MKVLEERDAAHVGTKTATFRTEDIANSAEFRRSLRIRRERGAARRSAVRAFAGRTDQASRAREDEHARALRRCVYAVHRTRRTDGQAPPHVGRSDLRRRRLGLRPALGREVRLPRQISSGIGRREPKKSEWTRGDFIYIPPFSIHQHFNTGETEARLIVISNRIVKAMGFNWLDQVEKAPGA